MTMLEADEEDPMSRSVRLFSQALGYGHRGILRGLDNVGQTAPFRLAP